MTASDSWSIRKDLNNLRRSMGTSLSTLTQGLARLAMTALLGGFSVANCQPYSPRVKDLPVETFDAGVILIESFSIPHWINNDQVLITALKNGAKRTFPEIDTPARAILAHFADRKISTIAETGSVSYFDRYTKRFMVSREHLTDLPDLRYGPSANKIAYEDLKELHFSNNGDLIVDHVYPPGSEPPNDVGVLPREVLRTSLGHPKDGYLIRVLSEGDTLLKQGERNRRYDEPLPTAWMRPGLPLLPVPVRYDEISRGLYVEFMDKFQLNSNDSAMSSNTSGL